MPSPTLFPLRPGAIFESAPEKGGGGRSLCVLHPSTLSGQGRGKADPPLLHPWVPGLIKIDLCLAHPHPNYFFLNKVSSSLPWSLKPGAPRTAGLGGYLLHLNHYPWDLILG